MSVRITVTTNQSEKLLKILFHKIYITLTFYWLISYKFKCT